MHPDRASRTAEFMALFRALESCRRPAAARLFDDPLAAHFLPARLRAVVALARLPGVGGWVAPFIDCHWPGALSSGVARTRLIDDALAAALAGGVRQVVLLGAGFDARAYRLPGIERARVIEIDHPATQTAKRERLARALGRLPAHVAFAAADLDRQPLDAVLDAAGFDRTTAAFFVWEGVTNYLTAAAVDATLRAVARAAPGSGLCFTYVHRGLLAGGEVFDGSAAPTGMLQRSGEPWTFGLEPTELPAYLAARGLALREDLGAADYRTRYLGGPGRGYLFYRVALASVSTNPTARQCRAAEPAAAGSARAQGQ